LISGRIVVNRFIALLKLVPEVIQTMEELGDPMSEPYISERRLRSIVKLPGKKQIGGFIC
jgi:hypothetical protein